MWSLLPVLSLLILETSAVVPAFTAQDWGHPLGFEGPKVQTTSMLDSTSETFTASVQVRIWSPFFSSSETQQIVARFNGGSCLKGGRKGTEVVQIFLTLRFLSCKDCTALLENF
jgi:hypothetical protein